MTAPNADTPDKPATEDVAQVGEAKKQTDPAETAEKPAEVQHPDRTRFGDWEKDGRCIDF